MTRHYCSIMVNDLNNHRFSSTTRNGSRVQGHTPGVNGNRIVSLVNKNRTRLPADRNFAPGTHYLYSVYGVLIMSDDVVTQFVNESSRRYYDEGVRARTWCRSHTTDTSVEKNAWKRNEKWEHRHGEFFA